MKTLAELLHDRDLLNSAIQAGAELPRVEISKTATLGSPRFRSDSGRRGCYQTVNGSFIAKARRSRRMTQAECAKFCGVPLRTFQRAEAGDLLGTSSTRRRIERALGAVW